MSTSAWAVIGAAIGPILVTLTWVFSRREAKQTSDSTVMQRTVEGALSTTETMRLLLEPLEHEIAELRNEVQTLRIHVQALETQVHELGEDPVTQAPDFNPFGRMK